ncbi:protein phosphatase 1 regulatory subunit 42-like isoform X1 [Homalodisca vitripennis]|uniref:protein phosphatase 1 regulatory subunit 42-like isoform X1 n=2 Tax=Homalodisca vitripennis TaxID=197043 RepID=UPI001EEA308B|nr:protein phosphatase 1 regulatory subunit 42-like isoform X1 [Homalodisca vitripennis]XP_046676566.1 protein phosphatase 1 regulatory subunit 42-like isoform X1 [Homalodisca vitripennis]
MVRLTIDYIRKTVHKPHESSKNADDFLKKITHLSLPEKSIDSIADLSSVKNLTVLYLHHNNLQVIENLCRNECLTHLYLQHNQISKMENLNGIKQLRKLYLGYNCISVIEGLDAVSALEELHVENQQLLPGETIYFDPRTVKNLSKCLRILDISSNNVASISDLKDLKVIEKLNANNNALCDLTAVCETICHWPRVEQLDFQSNEITREPKYKDKIIASTKYLRSLDTKDINDITRSFIHRFELVKEERREKMLKASDVQTPFSDEIASIAEHLPPGLRQAVSASVKKEAIPRAKSLTLSLMQVPVHSPGFLSDDSAMANHGLQARPSRRVSNAENLTRSRQKAEKDCQTSLLQLEDVITTTSSTPKLQK